MNETRDRLINCFKTVFPDLPEDQIPGATQATLAAWDSIGAITLMNVVEDEFQTQMDFDRLAELDSFSSICDYLTSEVSIG